MLEQPGVDQTWWDAAFTRQGHTGWSDRLVYLYDQPIRRACVERVLSQLHPRGLRGLDCIDAGCGTGDFAFMLHRGGAQVLAFDFSARVLDATRGRFGGEGERIALEQASVTDIPAPARSADVLTSITVLQHLVSESDHHRALTEIRRVLKPDGRALLLELAPPLSEANLMHDGHVIERPPSLWISALASAGLRIEREAVYPQWGITALRTLARAIDRMRGAGAAPSGPTEASPAAPPSLARSLLRLGFGSARMLLLALAWPLDRVFRLAVPERVRYYRLWIVRTIDGGT